MLFITSGAEKLQLHVSGPAGELVTSVPDVVPANVLVAFFSSTAACGLAYVAKRNLLVLVFVFVVTGTHQMPRQSACAWPLRPDDDQVSTGCDPISTL